MAWQSMSVWAWGWMLCHSGLAQGSGGVTNHVARDLVAGVVRGIETIELSGRGTWILKAKRIGAMGTITASTDVGLQQLQ